MPFNTATPNRLMNPTEAGTLRYSPVTHKATIPPMRANGRLRMISAACLSEENDENRSKKITPMVIGTMILIRPIARSIFSNDPPQTTWIPFRKPDLPGHPLLRLSHNAPDVPSVGIEADRQIPLEMIAVDTPRSLVHPDGAEIAEGNEGPTAVRQSNVPDGLDAVPILFRKPHDQIEPSMLFIHPGRGFSSDRGGDDLAHIRDVDAVPGDLTPIDIDRDVRLAEELLYLQIFDAPNRAENAAISIPRVTQLLQVVARTV